jgi:hypothetical protein
MLGLISTLKNINSLIHLNMHVYILLCIVSIILTYLIYNFISQHNLTYKYNMYDTTLQIVVAKYKENIQWTKYTNHNILS